MPVCRARGYSGELRELFLACQWILDDIEQEVSFGLLRENIQNLTVMNSDAFVGIESLVEAMSNRYYNSFSFQLV